MCKPSYARPSTARLRHSKKTFAWSSCSPYNTKPRHCLCVSCLLFCICVLSMNCVCTLATIPDPSVDRVGSSTIPPTFPNDNTPQNDQHVDHGHSENKAAVFQNGDNRNEAPRTAIDAKLISRQERVQSLRSTLQSTSSHSLRQTNKVTSEIAAAAATATAIADTVQHESKQVPTSCGTVLMKRVKIVLIRALTTWIHMNTSNAHCFIGIKDGDNKSVTGRNLVDSLASSILQVSRDQPDTSGNGAEFGDAQCLARIALNTVRLLMLDANNSESLSSLFINCSSADNKTPSARIFEIVLSSQKSTLPWRQQAVAESGFSMVDKLSKAQRRLLSETAPDWPVEAAACFNGDDTTVQVDDATSSLSPTATEQFDSAAVDALLYLSLGYVPDVKCPSAAIKLALKSAVHSRMVAEGIDEHDEEGSGDHDHDHEHDDEVRPDFFADSLKDLLSMNETTNMPIEDFHHLLESLHIGSMQSSGSHHEHGDEPHIPVAVVMKSNTGGHMAMVEGETADEPDHDHDHDHDIGNSTQKCFTSTELLHIYGLENRPDISYENLTSMFPALIQQQVSQACVAPSEPVAPKLQPTVEQKFGLGTLSVFVISIVSMVFLLIIPSTKRQSYRYIMSALIALSTSTMLGDALLHLLPQALAIHGEHGDHGGAVDINVIEVEDFVLKQLVVLCAIYAFYLFEMLVSGRHHAKSGGHSHEEDGHGHSHIPDLSQISSSKKQSTSRKYHKNGDKSNDGDDSDNKDEEHHHHHHHRHHNGDKPSSPVVVFSTSSNSAGAAYDNWGMSPDNGEGRQQAAQIRPSESESVFRESIADTVEGYKSPTSPNNNAGSQPGATIVPWTEHPSDSSLASIMSSNSSSAPNLAKMSTYSSSSVISYHPSTATMDADKRAIQKGQKEANVTATSCGDGFLNLMKTLAHELVPKKTFGWMVIMGDAIHNLIDGIAIGASFSEDLVSGLSTSIAIACHEIPHEVGDFAALLTSGLTWRAALIWNVIHTLLAFVGLYIGLGISTDVSMRQWVFALTAGMFIYVSLTEMMPELTRIKDNFWKYFAWQNAGLLFGFGLMLVIAIFEDKMAIAIAQSYSGA